MTEDEPRFFPTQASLRTWFRKNHRSLTEAWIGYYRKATGRPSITWEESVDEALCVGWIDGIRKSHDESSFKVRFTPRKPTSAWSARNIERITDLLESGQVLEAGREAYEKREESKSGIYSFEQGDVKLSAEQETRFRANRKAWKFFSAQPAGYRKTSTWWVISAKREETRSRRLDQLIADSEAGLRIKQLRR